MESRAIDNAHSQSPRGWTLLSTATYLVLSIFSGIGLVGKADFVRGVLHIRPAYVEILIFASLAVPFFWPLAVRFSRVLAPLILAGFAGTVLFVYPHVVQLHKTGRGSDQADCVIVAGNEMLHGNWPYQRDKLWSHNEMSCGPGWAAVQAPFIASLGYRCALLAIWLWCLIALSIVIGWRGTSALIAAIFLSSGTWLAAADGTDFLTFGICIATLMVVLSSSRKRPPWLIALLGLVVQFRLPTLFLPLFMDGKPSRRAGILASCLACATFVGFLLWHPQAMIMDGPVTVLQKFGRHAALYEAPVRTTVLLVAALGIGGLVCWRLACSFSGPAATLVYMMATFGMPAILDLVLRIVSQASLTPVLRDWNGGPWLVACLPLSAYFILGERLRGTSSPEPGLLETD